MKESFTEDKLEELLSDSQIKAQFFNFGRGLFTVYLKTYEKYGDFNDPTDSTERRYSDFMEVREDMRYITGRTGGESLLNGWFEGNKEYVGKMLFGKHYDRVAYLERILIENKKINEFVYSELITEFLRFVSAPNERAALKYDFSGFIDARAVIFPAYIEALESVYRLYIQDALK